MKPAIQLRGGDVQDDRGMQTSSRLILQEIYELLIEILMILFL